MAGPIRISTDASRTWNPCNTDYDRGCPGPTAHTCAGCPPSVGRYWRPASCAFGLCRYGPVSRWMRWSPFLWCGIPGGSVLRTRASGAGLCLLLAAAAIAPSEVAWRIPSTLAMGFALLIIGWIAARLIHPQAAWFAGSACLSLHGINYSAGGCASLCLRNSHCVIVCVAVNSLARHITLARRDWFCCSGGAPVAHSPHLLALLSRFSHLHSSAPGTESDEG